MFICIHIKVGIATIKYIINLHSYNMTNYTEIYFRNNN